MDAIQFEQRAREDPQLRAFLQEVAEEAAEQVVIEQPQRFAVTGVDLLLGVAAYALFRYLKGYFDHRRNLGETETIKQRAQLIADLVKDGFPPEHAETVIINLLNGIAKRTEDDPALKVALALVGKGQS